jgi:hypothetical protein
LELELRELAFAAEVFFIRREDQNVVPETREGLQEGKTQYS